MLPSVGLIWRVRSMADVPPHMHIFALTDGLPGATGGEAVACIFALDRQLLAAFDGARSSVRLMRALRLEGCEFKPQGSCLVGCLDAAPDLSLTGAPSCVTS